MAAPTTQKDYGRLMAVPATDKGSGWPAAAPAISRVINQFKGATVKRAGMPLWQRSFHDHAIRDQEDHEKHSKYIAENPLRWQHDRPGSEE